MSLENIIKNTNTPSSKNTLIDDFRNLGLQNNDSIIVHSSLSKIGYVIGGACTVISALMEIVSDNGNIVMPSHSGDLSDPSKWENPPVPQCWVQTIKDNMPAFDRSTTPTFRMGQIVEQFRTLKSVHRSYHPHHSFLAWGKDSESIVETHSLEFSLGENSPLKKAYDMNFKVLLLGVSYGNNTSFHLSEYRCGKCKTGTFEAPILKIENGCEKREWAVFEDIMFNSDLFEQIGKDFEKEHKISTGKIGNSDSKLFNQRDCVDFATEWLQKNLVN